MITLKSVLNELSENKINQVVASGVQAGWSEPDGSCPDMSKMKKSKKSKSSKKSKKNG